MKYIDFLNVIKSGITFLTQTGETDVIYTQFTLEDLIELDPQSYPGSIQSGKSIWITPTPMTLESEDRITYGCRIYIAQQIKEDMSDRITAISNCIDTAQEIIDWLEDYNAIFTTYPITITPVLLFDSTTDGIYMDLNVSMYIPC